MRLKIISAVLLLWLSACAPKACSDEDRVMDREVEVLIGDMAAAAKEAKRRLVERGKECLPILETGIYYANSAGRIRIVSTLLAIADPEVMPLLRYIAKRDEDTLVREEAASALKKLDASMVK